MARHAVITRLLLLALYANAAVAAKGKKKAVPQTVIDAAGSGEVAIVEKWLSKRGNKAAATHGKLRQTMLHQAKQDAAVVKLLIESHKLDPAVQDASGDTPLHFAARSNNVPVIEVLVAAGAPVDEPNIKRQTALMTASLTRAVNIAAGMSNHMNAAKTLLEAGAKPDAGDANGNTPLVLACGEGHTAVAVALLAGGASIDKPNNAYATPLMLASLSGHPETVRALLKAGADAELQDRSTKAGDPSEMQMGKEGRQGRDALAWAQFAMGQAPLEARGQMKEHQEVIDILKAHQEKDEM